MSEWDSSVREESLGVFCHRHGFYDCPVCKGENPVWEIPVMEGDHQVGTLSIPWAFDDTLILISKGEEALTVQTQGTAAGEPERSFRSVPLPRAQVVSIRANPGLLAKVKRILE